MNSELNQQGLDRYVEFYEAMSATSLDRFAEVMTEDACFRDPFNDVQGLGAIRKIFAHMFDNLTEIKFTVRSAALVEGGALLSWELTSKLNGKPWNVLGMSEIRFAADGRVTRHIDHWDAGQQFYEHLPIVGWLLRAIRKRLQVA